VGSDLLTPDNPCAGHGNVSERVKKTPRVHDRTGYDNSGSAPLNPKISEWRLSSIAEQRTRGFSSNSDGGRDVKDYAHVLIDSMEFNREKKFSAQMSCCWYKVSKEKSSIDENKIQ
jgi:hypothetical protein